MTSPIMTICRQIRFNRKDAVLAHYLLSSAMNKDSNNVMAKKTFMAVLSYVNISLNEKIIPILSNSFTVRSKLNTLYFYPIFNYYVSVLQLYFYLLNY